MSGVVASNSVPVIDLLSIVNFTWIPEVLVNLPLPTTLYRYSPAFFGLPVPTALVAVKSTSGVSSVTVPRSLLTTNFGVCSAPSYCR